MAHTDQWDYETNTILQGTDALFEDLATDDQFTANIEVVGAYNYSTVMGGETSAPWLKVVSIKRR